jgi:hypothetical protein
MRYSIMLQVVGIITLILVGMAGLFAWLQNREVPPSSEVRSQKSEVGDGAYKGANSIRPTAPPQGLRPRNSK